MRPFYLEEEQRVGEEGDCALIHEARCARVRVVRELWLLREQARVQAMEREFLGRLQRLLDGSLGTTARQDEPDSGVCDQVDAAGECHPIRGTRGVPEAEARCRERVALFVDDATELRRRQAVTNMSPEFRAILEGSPVEDSPLQRENSWTDFLTDQRYVRNALESEFSHQLEMLLVGGRRRDGIGSNVLPSSRRNRESSVDAEGFEIIPDDSLDGQYQRVIEGAESGTSRYIVSAIRSLEREVAILKNVINASFDIQLDIQRSIKQEVAAAVHSGTNTGGISHVTTSCKPLKAGTCTICMETPIDSVLYTCGHMCSCSPCGRSLLASGMPCPICRAPVRDIVRIFTVNGGTTLTA
mmetsp:Transcript_3464/g.6495  ORF Transcript_3464/g.6495 Transcript_3464/m.6495 type:complete len:356 (-) Transcript_3464:1944-3011(-)|eukprot:CAMPEP_0184681850 /NCGR_PEP_ID=MMETSP0312-20130426/4839_1 /TAXON_ID=31354 /ORGANISM="Compsopogon coeruleus, Strain SAG 36.94" /LENGTH=355 /DNA_ID=CAMNT_0027132959 /DNA_START=88 /DNA_END=1155 /DNA_ORIENTATION=-